MDIILQFLITLISGGAIWEGFKFIYPEINRWLTAKREAKEIFYDRIDPILKSASELYGKLLSLAKEDFSTFINHERSNSPNPEHNKKYVYYLFAQFWANLEYLRLHNKYVSFSKLDKGKQLIDFIETFEARKYRLLDRSVQRIIGECLIQNNEQQFRIMPLNEFLVQIENNETILSQWVSVLDEKFSKLYKKEIKQNILVFGLIVAALIDNFDPEHKTIRERPYYINKLTEKSRMTIKHNLLKYYLTFIKNKSRYYK